MIKTVQYNDPDPITLYIPSINGGISTDIASQIELNQCDYCENMLYEDEAPDCRPGQTQTHTSYGTGGINGKFEYTTADGTIIDLEAWGTKLYTVQNTVTTAIYTALTNALADAVNFNGLFWLMNGTNFIKYDGTAVTAVTSGAYVPNLDRGCKPDGTGGTADQKLSYLSNSFKRTFSADGTATVYQLPFIGLSSIDSVTGTAIGYTTDLANGKVTFTSAPAQGTSNIVIQATKSGLMDSTKILKCKYIIDYQSRLWATGNPDAPTTVYNTGLTGDYSKDGSYWPENGWAMVGGDDVNTGFAMFLNELVLFKEKSIECARYTTDTSGNTTFGWRNVSPNIGCNMPGSIKSFQNHITFADTTRGPMVLVATNVEDQRNVHPIGHNIIGSVYKAGLLNEQESDLKNASSCDDGRRYWLCVGSKAWVWDYTTSPYKGDPKKLSWWFMTNINARCWLVKGRDVYYGDRDSGVVQKLTPGVYNDNGAAIKKVLRTADLTPKKFTRWLKDVPRAWLTLRKGTASTITMKCLASNKEWSTTIAALETSGGFNMDNFNMDNFSLDLAYSDKTLRQKLPIKNTSSFQIEFSNDEINQTLPIVSLELEFEPTREV